MNTSKRGRRFALGVGTLAGAAAASLLAITSSSAATQAAAPDNASPPAISGTTAQGSTLTASSGSWSGDTPITFDFQWRLCDSSGASCADIAGENGQTHTVGASEVGSTLRVTVTATNAKGSSSALTAATSVIIAASPPVNTAAPSLQGTAQAGQILSSSDGSWSGSPPPNFAYAWERCNSSGSGCAILSGQHSNTYAVSSADVGATIRSLVTATNSAGAATVQSGASAVIVPSGAAPHANGQGTVKGTLQVGQTLSLDPGGWSGTGPIAFSFQWQRCSSTGRCTDVGGATGQTYLASLSDVGYRLRALVTGRNPVGASSTYSNLTSGAIVAVGAKPALITAPSISGTAQVGAVLQTTAGTWSSATKLGYSYAWLRCDARGNGCTVIKGATGTTWRLTAASAGQTIRSQVTATNQGGTNTAQSIPNVVAAAPTGPVAPSGLIPLGGGRYSVSATAVSLPQRLIISGVSFSPSRLTTRAPFTARFKITDTRGYAVRDALVYLVALPYGWTTPAAEVKTDTAGNASIVVHPTASLPLRRSAVVMFVRARAQGGDLLAGVSTRRLVQVLTGR